MDFPRLLPLADAFPQGNGVWAKKGFCCPGAQEVLGLGCLEMAEGQPARTQLGRTQGVMV